MYVGFVFEYVCDCAWVSVKHAVSRDSPESQPDRETWGGCATVLPSEGVFGTSHSVGWLLFSVSKKDSHLSNQTVKGQSTVRKLRGSAQELEK